MAKVIKDLDNTVAAHMISNRIGPSINLFAQLLPDIDVLMERVHAKLQQGQIPSSCPFLHLMHTSSPMVIHHSGWNLFRQPHPREIPQHSFVAHALFRKACALYDGYADSIKSSDTTVSTVSVTPSSIPVCGDTHGRMRIRFVRRPHKQRCLEPQTL